MKWNSRCWREIFHCTWMMCSLMEKNCLIDWKWEKDWSEFVALSYESWRIYSRIPFFVEMTLRHWEISSRSFETTCSTSMSVDCLRELTSSRISSPLKFLRKVGNRLHSTASYCRQTESSAAPLTTYMCMSLAATIKVTSGCSVQSYMQQEVVSRVRVNGRQILLVLVQHQHKWGQSSG